LTLGRDLISPDPVERRQREAGVRDRLALGARLECAAGILVPIFGRQPVLPDLTPLRSARELEEALFSVQLRALGQAAAEAGVPIVVEPLNRYESYFCRRLADGARLIAEAGGGPGLGLLADFFHMNIEEADIPEALRTAGSLVRYVHVADSNRLQPGRGHLDLVPGFRALKEIGYDGWIGLESGLTDPPAAALVEGAEVIRAAWQRA
jgi:sugar phosphate isomerase/epimerase